MNDAALVAEKRALRFHDDPLAWLEHLAAQGKGAAWVAKGELCVVDARAGRAILANADAHYAEHSDFFMTRSGLFGPRETQLAMGRAVRQHVSQRLREVDIPQLLRSERIGTDWPRAGCELVRRFAGPLASGDYRSRRFNRILDDILETRVLNREGRQLGAIAAAIRRRLFRHALSRERANGLRRGDETPRDILDIVFQHAPHASDAQIMKLYAGFVIALLGSIGFVLGWTVLLAVHNGRTAENPQHLISEALRLYPIAWWMPRKPVVAHDVLGHAVAASDCVIVSPYAIHRDSAHWPEAERFLPERWAGTPDRSAWMPFGEGAHSCLAVGLVYELVGRFLDALWTLGPWRIEIADWRPSIAAALAPPQFRLLRQT
jgi:cytochrome P450